MCTREFLYDMNYTNCFTLQWLIPLGDSTYILLVVSKNESLDGPGDFARSPDRRAGGRQFGLTII